MSKELRFSAFVVIWAFVAGCQGCFGCQSPIYQKGSTVSGSCDDKEPPITAQKLDVLFVIDNSNSMKEEQEGVAREMTTFVSELRVAGGVPQDLRVGVITTAVYLHTNIGGFDRFYDCNSPARLYCTQSGKLQPVPDANPDGGSPLLGTGSELVLDSDDVQFVPKFARLVQQGVFGSGQETPFEALRIALTELNSTPVANGGTGGFLRDGARLLIVVLTDEDDCSERLVRPSLVAIGDQPGIDYCGGANANKLTPVTEYFDIISKIKDSKGALKEIIYTSIAPVSTTAGKSAMAVVETPDGGAAQVKNIDCPTSNGAGVRHRQMAEMFYSDLTNLDSICKSDYRQTLVDIANLAGVSQTIEVQGVPDPRVLQVVITRKDGKPVECTFGGGGFTFEPAQGDSLAKIHFSASCKRRRDDLALKIDRLCIY